MATLRLHKKIESATLEELRQFNGKNVEIIIRTEDKASNDNKKVQALRGKFETPIDGMEFQRQVRSEWK